MTGPGTVRRTATPSTDARRPTPADRRLSARSRPPGHGPDPVLRRPSSGPVGGCRPPRCRRRPGVPVSLRECPAALSSAGGCAPRRPPDRLPGATPQFLPRRLVTGPGPRAQPSQGRALVRPPRDGFRASRLVRRLRATGAFGQQRFRRDPDPPCQSRESRLAAGFGRSLVMAPVSIGLHLARDPRRTADSPVALPGSGRGGMAILILNQQAIPSVRVSPSAFSTLSIRASISRVNNV